MKIAMYEPDPRVCGPLSWAGHLRAGFEALGHEVKQVSSTKSGRRRKGWGTPGWGGHWWSSGPDIVCKDANLGKVLAEFDFIVLPEPKSPAEDKQAVKEKRWPLYYLALWEAKTPFVTALHGNDYNSKTAPFMEHILALPGFTGKLMSHSERSRRSDPFVESIPYFSVPLPYSPRVEIGDEFPANTTVGTTGRFMFNKGSHLVAMAGNQLRSDAIVEIWGSCSTGLGTNATFAVYEAMLEHAAQYKRYGDQDAKRAAGYEKVTEHGNTIRPYHWDIRTHGGALVRYLGNYTDPIATASRLGVHVNLTGFKYSGGLVEFSTLEAMDAGSLCITPDHVSDDRFRTSRIGVLNPPGSVGSTKKNPEIVDQVAQAIIPLQEFAVSGSRAHREIVEHNREQIREISDPAKIAAQVLEESL
jgi:hypothetical protein